MKKRILSCLMALALCLTLLPTAALADEPADSANGETKQEQENQQENQQETSAAKQEEQPTEEETSSPALLGTPAPTAAQAADTHTNHPICGMNCSHAGEKHTANAFDNATKLWMKGDGTLMKGEDETDVWTPTAYNSNSKYLPLEEGSYYLGSDLTLTDAFIGILGTNVTLCLNGKTIKTEGTSLDYAILVDWVRRNSTPGHLTLTDCSTDPNKPGTISGGKNEAVELQADSDLDMYGGTITGSRKGVDFSSGGTEFNMHDGVITGNRGYGVYMTAGTFNMSGGKITGNNVGVFVGSYSNFNVSGKVEITGNTANGKADNVHLSNRYQDKIFTVTSSNLQDGAKIGVTTEQIPSSESTVKIASAFRGDEKYIESDMDGYQVQYISDSNDSGVVLAVDPAAHAKTCKNHLNLDKGTEFIPWTDAEAKSQYNSSKTASNSLPKNEGNYYLVGDVTLTDTWEPKGGTVLCLNGHSITMNGNNDVIKVGGNVTFTLTDCNNTQGKITHAAVATGRGVEVNGGTFNMYGGKITGNAPSNNDGGGVYVRGTSSAFNMSGGSITNNTTNYRGGGVYVGDDGTFAMSGSASIIKNEATESGGGVYVGGNNSTFNMSGSTSITGNTAKKGGGVGVYSGATFNMSGSASVTSNKTTSGGYGGGVYMGGGKFTMNGNASITGNTTTSNGCGGGVHVGSGGTFTMNDNASVSRNLTENKGGGVYVIGSLEMNGNAKIEENTALTSNGPGNGGGVYVGSSGTFTVSGAPTVMDNKKRVSAGTADNNVYLPENKTIIIGTGSLTGEIGVTTENKPTGSKSIDIATGANEDYSGNFFSDDSSTYEVKLEGNKLVLAKSDGTTTPTTPTAHRHCLCGKDHTPTGNHKEETPVTFKAVGSLADLQAAVAEGGYYYLSADIDTSDMLKIEKALTLCLSGHSIQLDQKDTNANTPVILFSENATFTLTDCEPEGTAGTITHKEGKLGGGVEMYSNNTFNLYGGSITGNNTYGRTGGGVNAYGTFNLYGGSITNNTTQNGYDGGGVYVNQGCTFRLYGGSITGNQSAGGKGSGVYVDGGIEIPGLNPAPIKITGNTGDNLYLAEGKVIKLGSVHYQTSVGVTTAVKPEKGTPVKIADVTGGDVGLSQNITSDDPQYVTERVGATLVLKEAKETEVLVSGITLNGEKWNLKVGDTQKITATVVPDDATKKDVIWTSSNTDVATVENGVVTAKATGTAKITAKAADTSGISASCEITVTAADTPSQPGGGSTGGTTGGNTGGSTGGNTGSSGGGGSSSDRDSYDSNPVIKTETKNNADGSTTKTETRRDGSVTQTTTGKDGSVSKTETKKDGSSVTENKAADGSTGTVKTDKNGQTEAKTALSNKAIEDAKKSGEAVKAPVEVEASRNSNTAPTVKVELPKGAGETKVEIPVSNVKPGTVAVLVHPDGTEEIVKNSLPTEDGIQLTVNGNATVKIVDNSKDFIDTRNHWAEDEIDFVSARGLINGMSDTIYAPNASTTRAQLWTILARQSDANLNGGATWYEKAQLWSKDKGISDGTNPNAAINRAQMVTMLWRTMGQPAATDKVSFADVPAGSYYAHAVAWAVESGITTGVGGGRFDPTATCTRAQIAAFLARSMK